MITTFEELKPLLLKTKENFKWHVYDGSIRTAHNEYHECCPITACRKLIDGNFFYEYEWEAAAENHIDFNLALTVARAADEPLYSKLTIDQQNCRAWLEDNLFN